MNRKLIEKNIGRAGTLKVEIFSFAKKPELLAVIQTNTYVHTIQRAAHFLHKDIIFLSFYLSGARSEDNHSRRGLLRKVYVF
jgi:hypothetical protein